MIPLFVGYDPREALAYHVFTQSVIERSSVPVAFMPLHKPMLSGFDGQRDGTNAFIFSRFLVPHLMGYQGWAIFADGDMTCLADIAELYALRDESKAAMVAKHDYKTKYSRKYIGSPLENDNVDYPKKNQSSVILWNCAHPSNRILSREFVQEAGGQFLHRFQWLRDEEVGAIPLEWNWLVREYEDKPAKLKHHTLGSPAFAHYQNDDVEWHRSLNRAMEIQGESPVDIVGRARQKL